MILESSWPVRTEKPSTIAGMTDDLRRDRLRRNLRSRFEQSLEERLDRHLEVQPHGITPLHHFSYASRECIASYRDGHFFSSVSLSHSLVDGITRFACTRNGLKAKKDIDERIRRLLEGHLITTESGEAMQRVWNSKRNDFHHMNPSVPTDLEVLRHMAKANLADLVVIEGNVFAFTLDQSRIVPTHRQYWDVQADGSVPVYLRFD